MSSNKRIETNKRNLTPYIVFTVIGVVIIFFIALFALQPSAEENFFGGEISVTGDQLPDLSVNFNRDCVFFENFNYCQQLEPAANMTSPIISGTGLKGEELSTDSNNPKIILFLAHWCGHCQQKVKMVQKWINENGNPEPIKLYSVLTSINSGQPNYPPDKWLESENWTVPTFTDNAQDGVLQHFGVRGFPYMVLIDNKGKIITRLSGSYNAEQFEIILANTIRHDKSVN